jgi:hypothetical protein
MQVADRRMIASVDSMILAVLAVLDPDVPRSVHDYLTHRVHSSSSVHGVHLVPWRPYGIE